MKQTNNKIIFVTGINTDTGKTYATGLLARYLQKRGYSVITQKIIQTGCSGISEDILVHRKIMGKSLTEEDKQGLTCPYVFKLPASPHLAAQQEKVNINCDNILQATSTLADKYDYVIIEGIGGLYVPLTNDVMVIDYIKQQDYKTVLVTSPVLGSINQTLMSLELLRQHNIRLSGIIYNLHQQENELITKDSRQIFKKYLIKNNYPPTVIDMPAINMKTPPDIDFPEIFLPTNLTN